MSRRRSAVPRLAMRRGHASIGADVGCDQATVRQSQIDGDTSAVPMGAGAPSASRAKAGTPARPGSRQALPFNGSRRSVDDAQEAR